MSTFLSTLAGINQSYTEQLRLFWIHIPELTQDVRDKTEWVVSGKSYTQSSQNTQVTPIFDFPKIPPHKTGVHGEEEDDISYVDFAHHTKLDEKNFEKYSRQELETHAKELIEIFQKNIRIKKYSLPRYINRYWNFVDQYIKLLMELDSKKEKKYIPRQEWNIHSPYALSQEKRDFDTIKGELHSMEKLWEKEKEILKNWLENVYRACLGAERYWSIMVYFSSFEKETLIQNQKGLEKIINDIHLLLQSINVINALSFNSYKEKSMDELRVERENIHKNIQFKNIPTE